MSDCGWDTCPLGCGTGRLAKDSATADGSRTDGGPVQLELWGDPGESAADEVLTNRQNRK